MKRLVSFVLFLALFPLCGFANLRLGWDVYDIWMVREEVIAKGKKQAFEKDLKEVMKEKGKSKQFWPEYIVEGMDASNYIHLYPLKKYASLDAYFENGNNETKPIQQLSGIQYTINTIFTRYPQGAYLPDESYQDWLKTPFLHYWVFSLKYGQEVPFEYHLEKLVKAYTKKKTPLCFRTWKVTFGADLPKYVVVLFASEEQELDEHIEQFDIITPSVKAAIHQVKEGQGQLRPDLMKTK